MDGDASREDIDAKLAERDADRDFFTADEHPDGMATALLPDSGPVAEYRGGDRLLRADPTMSRVRTRWS